MTSAQREFQLAKVEAHLFRNMKVSQSKSGAALAAAIAKTIKTKARRKRVRAGRA